MIDRRCYMLPGRDVLPDVEMVITMLARDESSPTASLCHDEFEFILNFHFCGSPRVLASLKVRAPCTARRHLRVLSTGIKRTVRIRDRHPLRTGRHQVLTSVKPPCQHPLRRPHVVSPCFVATRWDRTLAGVPFRRIATSPEPSLRMV